jgi:hypothetical protein
MDSKQKYLKYKQKYLNLKKIKKQLGGFPPPIMGADSVWNPSATYKKDWNISDLQAVEKAKALVKTADDADKKAKTLADNVSNLSATSPEFVPKPTPKSTLT